MVAIKIKEWSNSWGFTILDCSTFVLTFSHNALHPRASWTTKAGCFFGLPCFPLLCCRSPSPFFNAPIHTGVVLFPIHSVELHLPPGRHHQPVHAPRYRRCGQAGFPKSCQHIISFLRSKLERTCTDSWSVFLNVHHFKSICAVSVCLHGSGGLPVLQLPPLFSTLHPVL